MGFVSSNWKITYDLGGGSEYQLLNWGDEIDDEISFPGQQSVDTGKPIGGAAAVKFGRGQIETQFSFAKWKTHADQATARNWLMELAAAIPTGVSKNLRVDVYGGSSYLLNNAVIVSWDPRMVPGSGAWRTWTKFQIEGGKFAVI